MPGRDEVLARAKNREVHPLEVPEFGDGLYVRVLSAKDQLSIVDETDSAQIPFKMIIASVCDESGELVFQSGDEGELGEFPFPVIDQVAAAVLRANGLTPEAQEEAVARFGQAQGEANSSE